MNDNDFNKKHFNDRELISDYINEINKIDHQVLNTIHEYNQNHPQGRMQITPGQGALFNFLIKTYNIKNILEIGVFTGYSTLIMALSLPADGKITAIDKSDEFTSTACKYWEKAGMRDKINLIIGDAAEIILSEQIQETKFDMIFIDANKMKYKYYFENCINYLSKNGIMVFDNTLWRGIAADENPSDRIGKSLRKFNKFISENEALNHCLLPLGDGMMLVSKND